MRNITIQIFSSEFGLRLRALRKQKGLTQAALGQEIGVDANYISRLERGVQLPSFELLLIFRCFFGRDMEYLTSGADLAETSLIPASVALALQDDNSQKRDFIRSRLAGQVEDSGNIYDTLFGKQDAVAHTSVIPIFPPGGSAPGTDHENGSASGEKKHPQ